MPVSRWPPPPPLHPVHWRNSVTTYTGGNLIGVYQNVYTIVHFWSGGNRQSIRGSPRLAATSSQIPWPLLKLKEVRHSVYARYKSFKNMVKGMKLVGSQWVTLEKMRQVYNLGVFMQVYTDKRDCWLKTSIWRIKKRKLSLHQSSDIEYYLDRGIIHIGVYFIYFTLRYRDW